MFGRVLITLLILHRFELTKIILYTPWKVSKYGGISGPYFPLFRLNTEITDQKKLRIWTRFTQWYLHRLVFSRFFDICGNLGNVKLKLTRKTCFSRKMKRLSLRIYLAKFCLAECLWCQRNFYYNFMRKRCWNGVKFVKSFKN